ncbi:MAG TPA: metalloregulator ArsR/SmtB family transcription factor [Gemmatimonadales bacterium]|jgi:DNA-binding transcriptional ArsR family regulator|nr:metalloregulator ArsR/SmtB family transcription factor [Gemmatimonadales bacterium]
MPAAKRLLRRVDRGVVARAAEIIKLLGHRERLMILEALEQGELTVGEICELCDLGQAVGSQHLARLRRQGVVACRKEGLNVYYRIVEPKVHHILECIRRCDLGCR